MAKKTATESLIETLELIENGKLDADPEFCRDNFAELLKICNGCGAAGAKFDFVPDTIWGLSVTPVCNIHDFDYQKGKTIEDKQVADRRMNNNNLRIIGQNSNSFMKILRVKRALKYYLAVDLKGGPAFWAGK